MVALLILSFSIAIFGVNTQLIGYECTGSMVNKTTVSLIDVPPCEIQVANNSIEEVNVVLTQNSDKEDINVLRCAGTATHVIKRCGKWLGDNSVTGHYSEPLRFTRDSCNRLLSDFTYTPTFASGVTLTFTELGRHLRSFVSAGTSYPNGECEGSGQIVVEGVTYERAMRMTTLEITFTNQKATIDYEDKKLIFPSGIRCDLLRGACEHGDYGHLFWDIPTPECKNEVGNQAIVYKGTATLVVTPQKDKFIQVTHSGYDFQIKLTGRSTYICGFKSQYTEHPRLYVTFIGSTSAPFPKIGSINPREVSLLNCINSKIVYSLRHTQEQVEKLFRLFELDRCRVQNRITQSMITSARGDPISFAYEYFLEPGYTAVARGDVVHIAKCTPVMVDLDVRPNEHCFNELRVIYKNQTRFLMSRTRLLLSTGTIVGCSYDVGPTFRIGEQWVIQTKEGVIRTKEPQTIQYEPLKYVFEPLETLANGGLYTSETLLEYQKILTSPVEETIINSRIVSAIVDGYALPVGVDLAKGITEDGIELLSSKIGSFWDSFWARLFEAGNWFSTLLLIVFLFKIVVALVNYIVNFNSLRGSYNVFIVIIVSFFEAVCRNFHQHKKDQQQAAVLGPITDDETNFMV